MKVLTNLGAPDEISNADDGSMIERLIFMVGCHGGLVKDGVTRKSVLFVIYQTGVNRLNRPGNSIANLHHRSAHVAYYHAS